MSCPNSQNPLILNVSMGALPEGFCPPNLQELANAIAARLIISPSEASLNISGGSTEPASNIGPWFKNCEELNVYNDETGRYVPIAKGGFDTFQVFAASGTFVVPDGIFKIYTEGWGGGGGGHDPQGGSASSGAGGGGFGRLLSTVTPGQAIPVTVGVGGINGAPGANGGDSVFLGMNCGGGKGATAPSSPGIGGITIGANFTINGGNGAQTYASHGGAGGDSPQGGMGAVYSNTVPAASVAVVPGGGGCGGSNIATVGTPGAAGRICVWY